MFGLVPFDHGDRFMNNMFNDFDHFYFDDDKTPVLACRTDIEDKGDHYLLSADLPGFKKEDIKLGLDGDVLTISAEHSDESEKKNKDGSYVCRERHYGSYSRSFDVSSVKKENITAAYKNGVLELTLPKTAATPEPENRTISIE